MRPSRGFTLLELMVTIGISTLMLGLATMIYVRGSALWAKTEAQSDIEQTLQSALALFSKDLAGSSLNSLTVDPTERMVSIPSARDAQGEVVFDAATRRLMWQRYYLYYYEQGQQTLHRRNLDMSAPTQNPVSLPLHDFGAGPQAIPRYRADGRPIAREVTEMECDLADGLVTLRLTGERKRYGSERLERVQLETVVYPRN